jgi:hypothetical protein
MRTGWFAFALCLALLTSAEPSAAEIKASPAEVARIVFRIDSENSSVDESGFVIRGTLHNGNAQDFAEVTLVCLIYADGIAVGEARQTFENVGGWAALPLQINGLHNATLPDRASCTIVHAYITR